MVQALERLQQHRSLILTAEIAALLHLLGKLDGRFIEAESIEGGGHYDYQTFYKGTVLEGIVKDSQLGNFLRSSLVRCLGDGPQTLEPFFTKHADGDHGQPQVNLLQQAHGIVSGLEKNLHKGTASYLKQSRDRTFAATAFGYEFENLSEKDLASIRDPLLPYLKAVLEKIRDQHAAMGKEEWWEFSSEVKVKLQLALSEGVGDTRRPVNEVTLWDQSYMTACLYKSALAELILTNPTSFDPKRKIKWRILAVGIDVLALLFRSIKIGDATGLRKTVTDALNAAQRLIETDLCLGNEIYRDTSGIYFSYPNIDDQAMEETIREKVHRIFADHDLEVSPAVGISGSSRSFLRLVESREKVLEEVSYPVRGDLPIKGGVTFGNVCPVCQLRLNGDPTERDRVCGVCQARRQGRQALWRGIASQGDTIWLEEVADRHDRVVLLVAQFDLTPWLSGEYAETLRVQSIREWITHNQADSEIRRLSSPEDLLGQIEQHWTADLPLLKKIHAGYQGGPVGQQFYQDVVEERDVLGHANQAMIEGKQARLLLHYLFKKYPSPARIRRFWETTQDFWGSSLQKIRSGFSPTYLRNRRLWIIPDTSASFVDGGLYDGTLNGHPISLLWEDGSGRFLTVSNLEWLAGEGETVEALALRLTRDHPALRLKAEGETRWVSDRVKSAEPAQGPLGAYWPVIPIVEFPSQFVVLLPAAQGLEAVQLLKRKYEIEMSKVRDRLPLHLGLVYFSKKMPLFTVLEAGRRMAEVFAQGKPETWEVKDSQPASPEKVQRLELMREDGIAASWDMSYGFGDPDREDWFTPYLRTECEGVADRPHTFAVSGGPDHYRVHVTELRPGNRIRIHPSRFTFLFLDISTRRFEAATRVRYLEDEDDLSSLWQTLKARGLTDTQLHAGWSIIERARLEWGIGPAFEQLVESALTNEWGLRGLDLARMKQAIWTGLLDETMEIFPHIMKARMREESGDDTGGTSL